MEFGHEDQSGEIPQAIRVLGAGSHFGEIALINDVKRTLSVRVTSDKVKLLLLARDAFTRILGSIKKYLKEDYKQEKSVGGQGGSAAQESK